MQLVFLTVGDWVTHREHGAGRVSSIDVMSEKAVLSVYEDGGTSGVHSCRFFTVSAVRLHAIPITDSWLIRMSYRHTMKGDGFYHRFFKHTIKEYNKNEWSIVGTQGRPFKIRYVHELQGYIRLHHKLIPRFRLGNQMV